MKIGDVNGVNPVSLKPTEKTGEKPQAGYVPEKQVTDLQGMDAVLGSSQVKHVMHVGSGSPILEKAAPIISKDVPAQLQVATEPGSVMDIWSGREVPYDAGDIVMYYGTCPYEDKYVHDNAKAKFKKLGEPCVLDYNRSVEPDIMRETYVNAETGKYLIETGELEAGKAPINAIKRAKGGCLIAPVGTKVHTRETVKHNLPPVEVLVGQVVALDHRGNPYVQDVTQMLKRNKPTDAKSEQMFADMKEFVEYREFAYEEYAADKAEFMIADAWANLSKKYM